MKIDIFTHIFPPKYFEKVKRYCPLGMTIYPALIDLEQRFRIMEGYSDYKQVLTFSTPPLEAIVNPQEAIDLARQGNDEMAELIAKYPDCFLAGVANLPLNDVEASLQEIDRAIKELGLKGILIYSNINGKPLDSPEYLPVFEKMNYYDLPIWIHPRRDIEIPDYTTEEKSKYKLYGALGWPFETQLAMSRLVCRGILEKYPTLKIITHHCGGGMPFLGRRVSNWLLPFTRGDSNQKSLDLSKEPLEYLRMFYGDTANIGGKSVLECGYVFFGAKHMLFGTDMPFGEDVINEAIQGIMEMAISDADKELIFEGNARRLLHLND